MANNIELAVRSRIREMSQIAPTSIGDMLSFQLLSCDEASGVFLFSCKTSFWMRNPAGNLHGGMCAAVLDQAMGYIAYCVNPGEGSVPAVQLQVSYHRPFLPGNDLHIKVRVVSVTRSLISLSAEAVSPKHPEKACFSGTGTYFYKEEMK